VDDTGSGEVAHRTPVAFSPGRARLAPAAAVALAGALLGLWLIVDPHTPDLAAQVYRASLFRRHGFALWDEHWYAGHHLPGYSLLFPPLGAVLGVRVVGAIAVLLSVTLFERLARELYGAPARLAACWFAVAAVGDVWVGRLSFALGASLALAAAFALLRRHPIAAGALAALCAAASPVAGALLGLAALTAALSRRSPRALLVLALPAAAVVLALALLFPEGGFEPYPLLSFLATVAVVAAFLWALPPGRPALRAGAWIYLVACGLCVLVHTPIGSNIERYGVLLAGPLLLCARPRASAAAVLALSLAAVWVLWGPVRETRAVAGDASTSAAYYVPVERFAAALGRPVRIEVPLTRSHWEAALLAPAVSLARGWEKQLDERYDGVLLRSRLDAGAYRRWLDQQAVAYVALPDAPLDSSSAVEGRLIRHGLPYLRLMLTTRHWRIFEVLGATPLVSGRARLTSLGHDAFGLRAEAPGSVVVRVRFTRYWTVVRGRGCVGRAPGGWTRVTVRGPGPLEVAARFSLARALGTASGCVGGAGG
jgi:hypothetical protein